MQQDSCIFCAMLMIDLFISLLLPVLLLVAAEDCQSVVWNLLSCGSSWLHTRQRNPGVYCVYITTIGCTTSESVFSVSVYYRQSMRQMLGVWWMRFLGEKAHASHSGRNECRTSPDTRTICGPCATIDACTQCRMPLGNSLSALVLHASCTT